LTACNKDQISPDNSEEVQPIDNESINLLPAIGPVSLPLDTDSICPIPLYLAGDYDVNAIPIGSQVPDFTFYDPSGSPFHLESVLSDGKPIFLMTGSVTCPVFRSTLSELNNLISTYEDSINFLVVYTVEAHPEVDFSPYSGTVWTTNANLSNGILFEQPKTYGERVALVNYMTANASINCDILVDGPCNEFWLNYGEAPNRAYLIDATGQVVISHGWFDYPSMVSSIDNYLGM
jgi:hypothetical protein